MGEKEEEENKELEETSKKSNTDATVDEKKVAIRYGPLP